MLTSICSLSTSKTLFTNSIAILPPLSLPTHHSLLWRITQVRKFPSLTDSVTCKLYQRSEIWQTSVEHQGSQDISLIYFSYCSSEEVFSDGYYSVRVQSIDGVKSDVI